MFRTPFSMNNLSDYKSSQRRSGKNGSAESEGSHDELFTVSNRRKPGHLKDNLAEKKSNSAENAKKKGAIRKERAKKLKGNVPERNGESWTKVGGGLSVEHCLYC